jgi:hypothetical protein
MASAMKDHLPDETIQALVEACHGDPFAVLGPHEAAEGVVIRALVPGAERLVVIEEVTGEPVDELARRLVRRPHRGTAGLVRLPAAGKQ